jgi:hypothetical protein
MNESENSSKLLVSELCRARSRKTAGRLTEQGDVARVAAEQRQERRLRPGRPFDPAQFFLIRLLDAAGTDVITGPVIAACTASFIEAAPSRRFFARRSVVNSSRAMKRSSTTLRLICDSMRSSNFLKSTILSTIRCEFTAAECKCGSASP